MLRVCFVVAAYRLVLRVALTAVAVEKFSTIEIALLKIVVFYSSYMDKV